MLVTNAVVTVRQSIDGIIEQVALVVVSAKAAFDLLVRVENMMLVSNAIHLDMILFRAEELRLVVLEV